MVPFFANENPYCRGVVPNICRIANSLRSHGGTVAWVLPARREKISDAAKEFLGEEVASMFNESGGVVSLRERLWHQFDVQSNDILVEKWAASAFFPGHCQVPQMLEDRHITTVLIAGTVTNVCCESSARDASTLGYRVVMIADANATVDDVSHNATLHTIYRAFGDVRPTSDVGKLAVGQRHV